MEKIHFGNLTQRMHDFREGGFKTGVYAEKYSGAHDDFH